MQNAPLGAASTCDAALDPIEEHLNGAAGSCRTGPTIIAVVSTGAGRAISPSETRTAPPLILATRRPVCRPHVHARRSCFQVRLDGAPIQR